MRGIWTVGSGDSKEEDDKITEKWWGHYRLGEFSHFEGQRGKLAGR